MDYVIRNSTLGYRYCGCKGLNETRKRVRNEKSAENEPQWTQVGGSRRTRSSVTVYPFLQLKNAEVFKSFLS